MPPSPAIAARPSLHRLFPEVVRIALLIGAWLVFAGLPTSLWFERQDPPVALSWTAIGAGALFATLVVCALRFVQEPIARSARALVDRIPTSFGLALATGLALRVVVPLVVRAVPSSDGESYLQLAVALVTTSTYTVDGNVAYWPPGLPFLLAPLVALAGDGRATLIAYGLVAFVVGAFGLHRLARLAGLGRRAVVPVWLLGCWPTLVLCAGLPEKELMLVGLLPWVVLLAVRASRGSIASALGCGVVLGVTVLIQQSFILLAPVAFVACTPWVPRGGRRMHLVACAVIVVTLAAVVAPWLWRNHQVLGGPVVLTTMGGGNLYRANNELATGGYQRRGTVDLELLDELANDRVGWALALDWMRREPGGFARLVAGKLMLFAGDDSYGAYRALRTGQPVDDPVAPALYAGVKLVALAPWELLWIVVGAVAWQRRRQGVVVLASFAPYFYLSAVHAVFESGAKYHLPAEGCLFVALVGLLAAEPSAPEASSSTAP